MLSECSDRGAACLGDALGDHRKRSRSQAKAQHAMLTSAAGTSIWEKRVRLNRYRNMVLFLKGSIECRIFAHVECLLFADRKGEMKQGRLKSLEDRMAYRV